MTNREKNAEIAKACGWKKSTDDGWKTPDNGWEQWLPDYFSDPRACEEAADLHDKEMQVNRLGRDKWVASIGACPSCYGITMPEAMAEALWRYVCSLKNN